MRTLVILLFAAIFGCAASRSVGFQQLPLSGARAAMQPKGLLVPTTGRTSTKCWVFGPKQPKEISSTERLARQRRNNQLRNLEKDSERWFQEQDRREAAGELNLLENPAFYTLLFFATPIAILVWGAGTGIIPGFVPPQPYDYISQ